MILTGISTNFPEGGLHIFINPCIQLVLRSKVAAMKLFKILVDLAELCICAIVNFYLGKPG